MNIHINNAAVLYFRVIGSLLARGDRNVLANGFRLRRANDAGMHSQSGVECFFPNTVLNFLKTAEWEMLLTLTGERTYVLDSMRNARNL
jgi:hypothetical protein